jgi:alpha/beta superfamily hydrolase
MDFYLITDLVRELSKEGFSTLRFNYRGVPPSTGTFGEGKGELDDIVKAAEFLRGQQNVNPQRLGLIGYSFGASLVIVVAERVRPKVIVSISPQTHPSETRLDVLDYATRTSGAVMLIHGKADDIIPCSESEEIHEAMRKASPIALQLIEGANHLFQGRGKTVVSLATEFLLRNI